MGKVTLRKKTISKGRQTLYLDIYPPIIAIDTGKLKRRFYLKIYIYSKAKNELEKEHNRETLALAEHIRAKRQLDIQNRKYEFLSDSIYESNFVDFYDEMVKKKDGTNYHNWRMSLVYFKEFAGVIFPFSSLNERFCEKFSEYLLSSPAVGRAKRKIKHNTAVSYFAKFKATLKRAYKLGYLTKDLGHIVDGITPKDTRREFLSMDELQNLADSPCKSLLVKRAGLFSALTGFRFCDVKKLRWNEIRGKKGDYYIFYDQKKTETVEYYPASDQAIELLGEFGNEEDLVFEGLKYTDVDNLLSDWLLNASIKRHFTFHCFRHTFATLQIASGTSIYTVSKMLGHKSVKTTEIYAKIVDNLKKDASGRILLRTTRLII
ncbi:site-specific integrase [Chryseobacterium sp. ISL-6]|uniref:site-specific integrase n=1 Tax=Chryseobacterium sp. ISL-6 TaxID=2819143 RepID=UPI001BE62065|nr:site-specific integrase [Chryseobacterium sp. ISL-6]MBT2620610.1 site-specific integrase [Chryseobacterium sp. ISL-6]